MVYQHVQDLDFTRATLPTMPIPTDVLFTTPDYFDVAYVINPHMAEHVGTVDVSRAHAQWAALRETYHALGIRVHEIAGQTGLPDMVFCANQTLPFLSPRTHKRGIIRSQMFAPERRNEVEHFARFFENQGQHVLDLPQTATLYFEGMGDAIWHPGRHLLWGGYGFRTSMDAYLYLSEVLRVPVLALRLDDADFYHLDTCFCTLTEDTVLIYPGAFDDAGLALIHAFFDRIIEAPEEEARRLFACNAHSPDQKHVIIQEGCTETEAKLRAQGFTPVPVDTSEFIKAGGSVFCMKLMFWNA